MPINSVSILVEHHLISRYKRFLASLNQGLKLGSNPRRVITMKLRVLNRHNNVESNKIVFIFFY